MEKKWNLVILFPENFALKGKSLQFWGEIYHLDEYFALFLTKISEICKIIHIFDTIFDHIHLAFFQPCTSIVDCFHSQSSKSTQSSKSNALDSVRHFLRWRPYRGTASLSLHPLLEEITYTCISVNLRMLTGAQTNYPPTAPFNTAAINVLQRFVARCILHNLRQATLIQ